MYIWESIRFVMNICIDELIELLIYVIWFGWLISGLDGVDFIDNKIDRECFSM